MRWHVLGVLLGAFLFEGTADAQSTLYSYTGNLYEDFLGTDVTGTGDLDGDSVPDFAYSVPGDQGIGKVEFLSGATGFLLRSVPGVTTGDRYGTSIANVGDVNGDGLPDLLAGAPGGGYADVLSGADGSVLRQLLDPGGSSGFGSVVCAVGLVDGDLVPDFAISAPGNPNQDAGHVYLFSGATGLVLHTASGPNVGDAFGTALAAAGDLNNDGADDLLVGAPGFDDQGVFDTGMLRAISGGTGLPLFTIPGRSFRENFGEGLAAIDVTGDGLDEIAVSAPGDSTHGTSAGRVDVYLRTAQLRYSLYGDVGSARLGTCLASAGDVNGNGLDELLVGSWRASFAGSFSGEFRMYSGRTLLLKQTGNGSNERLGASLAGIGDLNGDGRSEYVVGAPWSSTGSYPQEKEGRAFVLSGATGGALGPGEALCFGDGATGPCPCGNSTVPGEGCAHSGGVGMTISGSGTGSVTADDLMITVTGIPAGNSGLLYAGRSLSTAGNFLFDGLQCAGGDVRRFAVVGITNGTITQGNFDVQAGPGYFVPGGTYTFQYWTQDTAAGPSPCGSGMNLSPAYRVTMRP